MNRQRALWLLALIVVLAVALRGYQLSLRSLWFDEAFSWRLIQFPLPEMLARAQTDVHPPLYYLLLRGWGVVFGTSLVSLRSFSVLLGAVTVALAYLFAATGWRARTAGLWAALLTALSGFQILFAWEARMYTLGTALVLLSSWLLLRAVRQNPQRLSSWLLYAVAAAAGAYVHHYVFFSLAAHAVFVAGYLLYATRGRIGEMLQWRFTWYALLSAGVAVVLYLPWLPTLLAQNAQVQQSFWVPAIGGWSIPDTFYRMFRPTAGVPRHEGILWITVALLPLLLTVLGWLLLAAVRTRRSQASRDAASLTVLLGVVPFGLSIILSFIGTSLYQDRFLVFAQLFVMIGLAVLLYQIPGTRLRRTVLIGAAVGLLAADVVYHQEVAIAEKPGARAAATAIMTERTDAAPVIASSPFVFFAIDHYATEAFGQSGVVKLYSETGALAHFAGGPILTPADTVGPEVFTAAGPLWVVDTSGFGERALAVPAPWRLVETREYPEVYGYQGSVFVRQYVR